MPGISASLDSSRPSPHSLPSGPFAVPGVDVLAEQRHLAHAGLGELFGLGDDLRHRPRHFRAARIGHDAEGAELVAAFLHGQEGRHAAADDLRSARLRQMFELVLDGVVGLDDLLAVSRFPQRLGQAVIGLRTDHQVDSALAADDLRSLRLRHAAGDADHRFQSAARAFGLEVADAAELGIDLFGGLLADMAGVQEHQVGVLDPVGAGIAVRRQRIRHALRIVDVHLAAIGLDEDLLRRARRLRRSALGTIGNHLFQFHPAAFRGFP